MIPSGPRRFGFKIADADDTHIGFRRLRRRPETTRSGRAATTAKV
jgi:hypothetical protein